jgi:hypothetical protein
MFTNARGSLRRPARRLAGLRRWVLGIPCLSDDPRRRAALALSLIRFRKRSPVGFLFERLFFLAQYFSLATILFGTRARAHYLKVAGREEARRSAMVEVYIVAWVALLAVGLTTKFGTDRACVIFVLGCVRVFDILQANINMHLFDGVRIQTRTHHVASLLRSTLISVWNYVELIGWFALGYVKFQGINSDGAAITLTRFDAVYFSAMTQLTVGYGDLKPATQLVRSLAVTQGLLGTMFVIFAIGRFASLLPQVRDRQGR